MKKIFYILRPFRKEDLIPSKYEVKLEFVSNPKPNEPVRAVFSTANYESGELTYSAKPAIKHEKDLKVVEIIDKETYILQANKAGIFDLRVQIPELNYQTVIKIEFKDD